MRLKYEARNAWEFERENNKLDDVMNYFKRIYALFRCWKNRENIS